MPANPYKEDLKCYKWIDMILKENQEAEFELIIVQALTRFAISEQKIINFIKKYEKIGKIHIEEGLIKKVEK